MLSNKATTFATLNNTLYPSTQAVANYVTANAYTLPIASASVLGGVKVGTGLSIDGTGVLSASGYLTTADNGLTTNTSTNVRLGGSLLQSTLITGGSFNLQVSGSSYINSLVGSNSSTGAGVAGINTGGGYGVYGKGTAGVVGYSTENEGGIFSSQPPSTNTVIPVLRIERATSGTASNGIGGSIDLLNHTTSHLNLSVKAVFQLTELSAMLVPHPVPVLVGIPA